MTKTLLAISLYLMAAQACSGQLQLVVDSIVAHERLYDYDHLDYRSSPLLAALATYPLDSLSQLTHHEHPIVRLYVAHLCVVPTTRRHDIDPLLASYLDRVIATYPRLVLGDITYGGHALAQIELSQLMTGDTSWHHVLEHQHPLVKAYAGRSLVRLRKYDLLDDYLPRLIEDHHYIHQTEGCNLDHLRVADYVLNGSTRPGEASKLRDRYRDYLLNTDNDLDFTAQILLQTALDSSHTERLLEILEGDRLPIAVMVPLLRLRDQHSTTVVKRLSDMIVGGQLSSKDKHYLREVLPYINAHTLQVGDQADFGKIHAYLRTDRDATTRRHITLPYYRSLHLHGSAAQQAMVTEAIESSVITRHDLDRPVSPTYKVSYK